ncbi:MAG: CotH kinase family protein [Planctomycetota bacterium]|nr:CotH kinase family protein [Planctomycetota bacterium]
MSPSDWSTIQHDLTFDIEVPALMWMGNDPAILVSVRRKSCDALTSAAGFDKVSLKIDVNEYVDGQAWYDLKKLSLENGDDEDVVTEGLGWALHRMATGPIGYDYEAALANWATVSINGVYTGLYVNAEQRDKSFLKNRGVWVKDETWLYHLDDVYSTTLKAGTGDSPVWQYLCYDPFQSPNGGCPPPDPSGLFVDLTALVDMKGMLTVGAVNAFLSHGDSLFSKGKNVMFADFSTGQKRQYYPWDLDSVMTKLNHDIFNPGDHYADALLGVPAFRDQFKQILTDLLQGPMHEAEAAQFLDQMEPILTPWLELDPNNRIGTGAAIAGHFQSKQDWIVQRKANVLSQIAND